MTLPPLSVEWAVAIFSVSAPLTMSIYKLVPRRRDDVATFREVKQLRTDLESRFDVLQRDVNRIAAKVGVDIWGS